MSDTTTTTRADTLRALAKRIETGEPLRALSAEIWPAAGCVIGEFDPGDGGVYRWWEWPGGPRVTHWDLSSLDAVAALQEAVLPGWRIARLWQRRDGKFEFALEKRSSQFAAGEAPTLCQAWLAALLRALAMEAERG